MESVTSGITEQIYFLPPECHSRRTRPASLTWSVGERRRISIKLAWPCREEKMHIKMPLRSPFHLLQKTIHSLPFHHVVIYVPSVIFKMAPKCSFFFCSKFAFVICMCKQSLCLPHTSRSSCCRSQTTPVSLLTEKYFIASSPETP